MIVPDAFTHRVQYYALKTVIVAHGPVFVRCACKLRHRLFCHYTVTWVLAMIAGPFHDLRQRPVHEEGPLHYEEKVEIERTSLLQVG